MWELISNPKVSYVGYVFVRVDQTLPFGTRDLQDINTKLSTKKKGPDTFHWILVVE